MNRSEPITQPVKAKKTGLKIPFIFVPIVGAIVMTCCSVLFGSTLIGAILSTPTPVPTIDMISIQNTANAKAWLPFTQTAAALPTNTLMPSATPLPTFTLIPAPTATTFLSILPINQSPTPLPVRSAPQQAVCPCSGDTLNCSDFSSHSSAQACFNYCISVGAGDIHRLDKDGNGSACESLP